MRQESARRRWVSSAREGKCLQTCGGGSSRADVTRIAAPTKETGSGRRCSTELRSCVKVEVDILGSPAPNKPHGFSGRKAILKKKKKKSVGAPVRG